MGTYSLLFRIKKCYHLWKACFVLSPIQDTFYAFAILHNINLIGASVRDDANQDNR